MDLHALFSQYHVLFMSNLVLLSNFPPQILFIASEWLKERTEWFSNFNRYNVMQICFYNSYLLLNQSVGIGTKMDINVYMRAKISPFKNFTYALEILPQKTKTENNRIFLK